MPLPYVLCSLLHLVPESKLSHRRQLRTTSTKQQPSYEQKHHSLCELKNRLREGGLFSLEFRA